MSDTNQKPVPTPASPEQAKRLAELQPIATLAKLLQTIENGGYEGHAAQYQHVAGQLTALLSDVEPDAVLYSIFNAFPSAGELYENVRYEHAGLCLHDIDAAILAETRTTELLKGVAEH